MCIFFFFQAEDGIRDKLVTGVQTCALPIFLATARSRGRTAPVRLIERRIGLLFASFLLLLSLATFRAGYLFAFKGSSLRQLAATQQAENLTEIAKRGTITDRRGTDLAVSEDASTVYATPFLVKD